MDPIAYQLGALRTEAQHGDMVLYGTEKGDRKVAARLAHCAFGMTSEASELAEIVEREISGKTFDPVNFGEELGDFSWYLAQGADAAGLKLDELISAERSSRVEPFPRFAMLWPPNLQIDGRLPQISTQLTIHAGRLANLSKREIFYGKGMDLDSFKSYLSVIAVLLCQAAAIIDKPLSAIWAANNAKLSARYKAKFTEEAAANRDLDKERQVLEQHQ